MKALAILLLVGLIAPWPAAGWDMAADEAFWKEKRRLMAADIEAATNAFAKLPPGARRDLWEDCCAAANEMSAADDVSYASPSDDMGRRPNDDLIRQQQDASYRTTKRLCDRYWERYRSWPGTCCDRVGGGRAPVAK